MQCSLSNCRVGREEMYKVGLVHSASTVVCFVASDMPGCHRFCAATWCLGSIVLDLAHADARIVHAAPIDMEAQTLSSSNVL